MPDRRAPSAAVADGAAEQSLRRRDLERFLTLVDAVVAIAITLLVLPLVDIGGELGRDESVANLLSSHWSQIWAFLLSFFVIARLWFFQHSTVRHLTRYDERIAVLMVLWTLSIVVLPFTTSLVAVAADDPLTKVLYVGTMALGTAFLALMEHTILRRPELSDGAGSHDPADAWVTVTLLLAALGLMLVVPGISYFPMLLLVLDGPILNAWRGREAPAPRA